LDSVVLDQFHLGVRPPELFHLFDIVMLLQFSLDALLQVAMNSLVIGIPVSQQAVS
jgi:hypothetical protein